MPVCFQLFRKGSTQAERFNDVDDAICQHLGVPADEEKYHEGWYDYIGFMLACGKSFAQITDVLAEPIAAGKDWALRMRAINHFLLEHYTTDAWWEAK